LSLALVNIRCGLPNIIDIKNQIPFYLQEGPELWGMKFPLLWEHR